MDAWNTNFVSFWGVKAYFQVGTVSFRECIYRFVLGSKLPLFSHGRDGHQPNSRGLYTHYKDSYKRWDDHPQYSDFWPWHISVLSQPLVTSTRLAGCLKAPLSTTLVAQPMRWAVYRRWVDMGCRGMGLVNLWSWWTYEAEWGMEWKQMWIILTWFANPNQNIWIIMHSLAIGTATNVGRPMATRRYLKQYPKIPPFLSKFASEVRFFGDSLKWFPHSFLPVENHQRIRENWSKTGLNTPHISKL